MVAWRPDATVALLAVQLLTTVVMTVASAKEDSNNHQNSSSCEAVRLKCIYNAGCSMALRNYMYGCSAVMSADPPYQHCPEPCQLSLIALTSTDDGRRLMTCHCKEDDTYCKASKARIEVCRPGVEHAHLKETTVSCQVAQQICAADTQCLTAFEYYHSYCRSMFMGRKCSYRCKNSISILRRQQKAAKLDTCLCDGQDKERHECRKVRTNMDKLCFRKSHHHNSTTSTSTEQPSANDETNDVVAAAAAANASTVTHLSVQVLLLCLLLTRLSLNGSAS
ncbi:growth arrest-specific protein 1 [Nilaparvata lugens]|uniref:growth arrest-specific protein 1 n=1 Tax=Nilaparvata lugens TaxID=108931 RepID=UPI00193D13AF|nr:growth arrest-specific protein 1 [Nilaparvata lugens]